MAKIESRLPFAKMQHTTSAKTRIEGRIPAYIIPESDSKLSDYEPETQLHQKRAIISRLKPPSLTKPNQKTSLIHDGQKTGISSTKKPDSIPNQSTVGRSSTVKQPGMGLRKPNTVSSHKPAGVISSGPPNKSIELRSPSTLANHHTTAGSTWTDDSTKADTQQLPPNTPTTASGLRKPLPVGAKPPNVNISDRKARYVPTVPPKPVLPSYQKSSPPKISQQHSINKMNLSAPSRLPSAAQSPKSSPSKAIASPTYNSKIEQIKMDVISSNGPISKIEPVVKDISEERSKPICSGARAISSTRTVTGSQTLSGAKTGSKLVSPSKRVSQSAEIISKKEESNPVSRLRPANTTKGGPTIVKPVKRIFTSNQMSSGVLEETTLEHASDKTIHDVNSNSIVSCEIAAESSKVPLAFASKLSSPSKIGSGLKKPSNIRKPLTGTTKLLNLRTCTSSSLLTHLKQAQIIPRTVTHQPTQYYQFQELSTLTLQRAVAQIEPLVDEYELHSVTTIPAVCIVTSTRSTISVQTNRSECNVMQSYCGLSFNDVTNVNEVCDARPVTANASINKCYTYLQQTEPNSYRKQLLNSFTVKEQLSPTAESHARHIASSIPQPWLSADLLETNNNAVQPINLIIPKPPVEEPRGTKSILHSIEESPEPPTNKVIQQKFTTFALLGKSGKFTDSPTVGVLGNLFSKIGGRRILARPQESPPRIRKALGSPAMKKGQDTGSGILNSRRKLSPKQRRRDLKSPRAGRQTESSSPKHKPLVQEDSPIRSKEAYYGGAHHHMLKPLDQTHSPVTTPAGAEQTVTTPAGAEHTAQQAGVTARNALVVADCCCFPYQAHSMLCSGTLKRCDTPITELKEMCRDDHMKFYRSSYGAVSTLPSSKGTTHVFAPAITSSQMMSKSLNHKRKHKGSADGGAKFITHYSSILRMGLPLCPEVTPTHIEQGSSALSKVTVAVRLKQSRETTVNLTNSYITADSGRGQLVLRDPSNESNMAPSCRRQLAAVPKFFAFDTVFGSDAMQMEVCKDTVLDILQSVLRGSDGCVTSFGQSKTGKSQSLIGDDSSCADFGIIPAAISWLYHMIEEQKVKTGARFSIRISALEIRGRNEELTDLLADCSAGQAGASPDQVQLTSTAVYGAQVENLIEVRAPDAEQAGYYLDAALSASHSLNETSEAKGSHFLFTLHIYQHHVEARPSASGTLVAGGRSRLHFIDLGPCAKSSSDGSALTLAALGSALTALLNGQRHFPQKESKLATLLKDSVGNSHCRTCILVHISTQPSQYSETLQILQLAARIHRMKVRRRNKISSNSSDDTGSTNSNVRRRRGIRMGTSTSLSDPDVSSSEQSVDTVIYRPGTKQRHPHQSPTVYRTTPVTSKQCTPSQENIPPSPAAYATSPYNAAGPTKKRLSDDETSSEGRRRMPRTNARVWPRANHTDNEIWLDAPPPPVPREQWHIPGNANPAPHNNLPQHNYYNSPTPQQWQQQHRQQQDDCYEQHHYTSPIHDQAAPWISLAQYNGHPGQIGHVTTASPARQAWPETTNQNPGANFVYPEVSKQELWVDGPTAFRKNIEGLTNNLHNDPFSPVKKHHRHGSNQNNDRADKSRHHHRTPSRKHRDGGKHCHQCGADIKKETKSDSKISKEEDGKLSGSANLAEEPTVSVKPFVKDWVIRHSKNNTPTKSHERTDEFASNRKGDSKPAGVHTDSRAALLEHELSDQDDMQLTVNLEEELLNLSNLPCSDDLAANTDDSAHQDEVHIDDSVSNVTADDRIGFESKEGSSFDENSLSEEVVEVCDAACQTEFTDSDTHSIQSLTLRTDLDVTVRTTTDSICRTSYKRESTEAFLDATLHGALLRKPDGASDPSLHKEQTSPSSECKLADSLTPHSNTLPRNAHLNAPNSMTNAQSASSQHLRTIKLQPYLSPPKGSPMTSKHDSSTLPKSNGHSNPTKTEIQEPPVSKPESKLKKLGLFRQHSNENQDKSQSSATAKKSKGSKLPSLRLSSKSKEPKQSASLPATPAHKADSSKKPSAKGKKSDKHELAKSSSKLPNPKSIGKAASFDVNQSPYRHYVLPKPSYTHADGCSDNSSCPSYPSARNKYSVSSGYDSMTQNSTEDISQATCDNAVQQQSEKASAGPWLSSESKSHFECKELEKIHQQRFEQNQLSENVTRQARIEELLYKQDLLKREMAEAKSRLMVPNASWNYDSSLPSLEMPNLHVASQIDRRNDEGYLEALEKETSILQKRVDACKSRIMLITSIL